MGTLYSYTALDVNVRIMVIASKQAYHMQSPHTNVWFEVSDGASIHSLWKVERHFSQLINSPTQLGKLPRLAKKPVNMSIDRVGG